MLKQLIREEKQNRVSRILLPASITVLLLGIFILPHFVFGIAVVHGGSMEPTLKDGDVLINGQKEQNPELTKPAEKSAVFPLSLGAGEYFVLGGNRGNSFDSRDRDFGTVTKEKVFGKLLCVIGSN